MGVEAYIKEMQRRREIRCPYCDELQTNDDGQYPVSYWGSESGPVGMECGHCFKEFFVEEDVQRTYKVAKVGLKEAVRIVEGW